MMDEEPPFIVSRPANTSQGQRGDYIVGEVTAIGTDAITFDIGLASPGMLPMSDFLEPGTIALEEIHVHDLLSTYIVRVNSDGTYHLSLKNPR